MTEVVEHKHTVISRRSLLGGGLKLAGGAALLGGAGSMSELIFAGAQPADAAPMMSTISFQLGWLTNTEFAGSYLAASKGYYAKGGLAVKILPGEGVDVEGIVGAGKALVGDSNADTCSAAVAQGADLKIIGAKYQKNPFCMISSAKKPITTPEELIGKKVGINAYNFTGWSTFLAVNGIPASKVHTVNEGYTSGPEPLADGEVDAWMGFITNEPTVLELKGFPVHTFLLAEFGYEVYADIYETTSTAIAQHKDELVEFLRAEREGWEADMAKPRGRARPHNVAVRRETRALRQATDAREQRPDPAHQDVLHRSERPVRHEPRRHRQEHRHLAAGQLQEDRQLLHQAGPLRRLDPEGSVTPRRDKLRQDLIVFATD